MEEDYLAYFQSSLVVVERKFKIFDDDLELRTTSDLTILWKVAIVPSIENVIEKVAPKNNGGSKALKRLRQQLGGK